MTGQEVLVVLSVWRDRSQEEHVRMEAVPDENRALAKAEEYRNWSEGSGLKVQEIVMVQGRVL